MSISISFGAIIVVKDLGLVKLLTDLFYRINGYAFDETKRYSMEYLKKKFG